MGIKTDTLAIRGPARDASASEHITDLSPFDPVGINHLPSISLISMRVQSCPRSAPRFPGSTCDGQAWRREGNSERCWPIARFLCFAIRTSRHINTQNS